MHLPKYRKSDAKYRIHLKVKLNKKRKKVSLFHISYWKAYFYGTFLR